MRLPGSIVRFGAVSVLPRPGFAAFLFTRCTVQVISASVSSISSKVPSSWCAKIRKRAPWRFTRHCESLKPPGGLGSSPMRSGPMKKSSGLSPTRAIPIAGWILYTVAILAPFKDGQGSATAARGRLRRTPARGWKLLTQGLSTGYV